jgi:hypothetical protein
MFVSVIHRIHDPEGFETAEAKAMEAGLGPAAAAAGLAPPDVREFALHDFYPR